MPDNNMGILFDSNNLEINPALLSVVTSEAVHFSQMSAQSQTDVVSMVGSPLSP
jgi:hypothetical protein